MPTETKKASPNGKAKTASKPSSASSTGRTVATRAVDLPVGAVLEVSDRVAELVGPFTDRGSAERRLKSYRTTLSRNVKRTERRGASARRKAATEARKRRNEVERRAREVGKQLTSLR